MNGTLNRWLGLIGLAVYVSAAAHHSTAMYDSQKVVTLTGVVHQFQWTNPHCYVQVLVPNEQVGQTEWAIETGTPGVSQRMGWTKNSLKTGDRITVEIHPMADGRPGGTLRKVTLPDGKVLMGAAVSFPGGNGPPPAP